MNADTTWSARVVEVCYETSRAIVRFEGLPPDIGAAMLLPARRQPAPDLIVWLQEREMNARNIAASKRGSDRDGWLEDADYFKAAIHAIGAAAA